MFRSKQPMKERKLAAVFVVKIFLLFAVEWAQSCQVVHHAAPGTKTTGNYIVVLNDETDHGEFEKIVDEIHKESPNSVIFEKTESPLIKMITANISADAAQKICSLDDVESVEEEGYAHGSISWAIDRIDQTSSTLDGYSNSIGDGQGVKILLLDTGINYDHCEFGGRAMYAGYDPMDKRLNTSQNGKDCSGHGTHVASVAVGATLGVATKANIYSIRVLDCNGIGQWSAVIDGLIFAMEKIMSTETGQPFVILMPLEGPFSNAVDHTLKNILAQNIPIIAAAGNGKIDACLVSPGGTDGVISVGGSINGDGVYSDTNAGMCVGIFAPAGLVMGATHDCDACKCTSIQSGTSIGAGLVAGVVALYLQKESNLSTSIIEAKLTQNCLKNAMNFSTLPSSLIANTPNCLLHILMETSLSSTALSEPVCCNALKKVQDLKSMMMNLESVIGENIDHMTSIFKDNVTKDDTSNTTAKKRIYVPGMPVESCNSLLHHSLESDYYWIKTNKGNKLVYCDLDKDIKGHRGFMRIANINMSVFGTECPTGLSLRQDGALRTCQRSIEGPGCSSAYFSSSGVEYTKVCGRVRGYQWSSPNAFYNYAINPEKTIDDVYVDGIILSRQDRNGREHIWTFAGAIDEMSHYNPFNCPCSNIAVYNRANIPSFVGEDYFCETGSRELFQKGVLYTDDPLWDGDGCGEMDTCCQKGEWFCKDMPKTSSDIELRLCGNENRYNEDTPIEIIELYVQ